MFPQQLPLAAREAKPNTTGAPALWGSVLSALPRGAPEHRKSDRLVPPAHAACEQAGGALAPRWAPLWSVQPFAFPETGSWCQSHPRAGASAMALRKELLKSIWYAFTALDVEKSGKVSKSQLKVRGTRGPGEAGRHTSSVSAA